MVSLKKKELIDGVIYCTRDMQRLRTSLPVGLYDLRTVPAHSVRIRYVDERKEV